MVTVDQSLEIALASRSELDYVTRLIEAARQSAAHRPPGDFVGPIPRSTYEVSRLREKVYVYAEKIRRLYFVALAAAEEAEAALPRLATIVPGISDFQEKLMDNLPCTKRLKAEMELMQDMSAFAELSRLATVAEQLAGAEIASKCISFVQNLAADWTPSKIAEKTAIVRTSINVVKDCTLPEVERQKAMGECMATVVGALVHYVGFTLVVPRQVLAICESDLRCLAKAPSRLDEFESRCLVSICGRDSLAEITFADESVVPKATAGVVVETSVGRPRGPAADTRKILKSVDRALKPTPGSEEPKKHTLQSLLDECNCKRRTADKLTGKRLSEILKQWRPAVALVDAKNRSRSAIGSHAE